MSDDYGPAKQAIIDLCRLLNSMPLGTSGLWHTECERIAKTLGADVSASRRDYSSAARQKRFDEYAGASFSDPDAAS